MTGARWSWIVVGVIGAVLGGAVGLVAFAYPPTTISPPEERIGQVCRSQVRGEVNELPGLLQEVGFTEDFADNWRRHGGRGAPPAVQLEADRCTSGFRVWGTPVPPGQRSIWQQSLEEAVLGPPIDRIVQDLADDQRDAERRAASVERELEGLLGARLTSEITDADTDELLEDLNDSYDDPTDRTPGEWLELAQQLDARFDELTAQRSAAASAQRQSDRIVAFAQRAQVHLPPSGLLPVLLGMILGAGAGLVLRFALGLAAEARRDQTDRRDGAQRSSPDGSS